MQIQQFGNNLSQCLQDIEPLFLLQRPLKELSIEEIHDLVKMFPQNVTVDPQALHAEAGNFINHVKVIDKEPISVADAAKFSVERIEFFSLTNRCYRLLMTAPVTVAKYERAFSQLTLVKTYLRTTMADD